MNNILLPHGRMRRLHYFGLSIGLNFLGKILEFMGDFGLLLSLALIYPGIMITFQRLHDMGKGPQLGWVLFALAFVGGLFLEGGAPLSVIGGLSMLGAFGVGIYILVTPGVTGPNEYGPDPLNPDMEYEDSYEEAAARAPATISLDKKEGV